MSMYRSMCSELEKLCAARLESDDAVARLKKLEEEKATPAQMARGALAGVAVGSLSRTAAGLATGDLPGAVVDAMRAPGGYKGKAKALGAASLRGAKELRGASAGSATFGALSPVIRGRLERSAASAQANDPDKSDGSLRGTVRKNLGV